MTTSAKSTGYSAKPKWLPSPIPVPVSWGTGTQQHVSPAPTGGTGKTSSSTTALETSTTNSVTYLRTVTDNAVGAFAGDAGLINYSGQSATLKVVGHYSASRYKADYTSATANTALSNSKTTTVNTEGTQKNGDWTENTQQFALSGGAVRLRYRPVGGALTAVSASLTPPPLIIDLCPQTSDRIVPGSVQFQFHRHTYRDIDGRLYRDGTETTAGTLSGNLNYETGVAELTDYVVEPLDVGEPPFVLQQLWTHRGNWKTSRLMLRTAAAPLAVGGFVVSVLDWSGTQLTAICDETGAITGDHAEGFIDYETGVAQITYGDWVLDSTLTPDEKAEWWYDARNVTADGTIWQPWPIDPATARYNAVSYVYLPLDADILGADPVRLPPDGRVPVFRVGDVVLVLHTARTGPVTPTLSGGVYVIDCGRERLSWVRVRDAEGHTVTSGYTLDRTNGLVKFASLDGLELPLEVEHTVCDQRQVRDVLITGEVTLSRALTHTFPAGESIISSCLIHGDRRARVSLVFDQATWTNVWADAVIGAEALGTLDTIAHPIQLTNEGAVTERWLLRWTNTTNVELIGERRGLVYTGPFTADIAPINPATRDELGEGGVPYLLIPVAANKGGWSAGNCVRINTVGALADMWLAQAIQQSDEPEDDGYDCVEIRALGNVDE